MTSDDQNLNSSIPEVPAPESVPAEPQPAAEPIQNDFVMPEPAAAPAAAPAFDPSTLTAEQLAALLAAKGVA
jgi:predicted component of type VI protein secretion system